VSLLATRTPGANSSSLRLSLCTNHHIDVLAAVCRNDTDLLQAVRQIQINTPKRVVWLSAEDRLLPSGLAAGIPETHFDALDLAAELGASVTSRRMHSAMKGTASVASCVWSGLSWAFSSLGLLLWGLMMCVVAPVRYGFKKGTVSGVLIVCALILTLSLSVFIPVGLHTMATATDTTVAGWIAGPAANATTCIVYNDGAHLSTPNCTNICADNVTSDACDGVCCANWCCLTSDAVEQIASGYTMTLLGPGVTILVLSVAIALVMFTSEIGRDGDKVFLCLIVILIGLIIGLFLCLFGANPPSAWACSAESGYSSCPATRYVNGTAI
jgi:hypothetical protein